MTCLSVIVKAHTSYAGLVSVCNLYSRFPFSAVCTVGSLNTTGEWGMLLWASSNCWDPSKACGRIGHRMNFELSLSSDFSLKTHAFSFSLWVFGSCGECSDPSTTRRYLWMDWAEVDKERSTGAHQCKSGCVGGWVDHIKTVWCCTEVMVLLVNHICSRTR